MELSGGELALILIVGKINNLSRLQKPFKVIVMFNLVSAADSDIIKVWESAI